MRRNKVRMKPCAQTHHQTSTSFWKVNVFPWVFCPVPVQSDHQDNYIFSRLHLPLASWVRSGDVPMLSNWPSYAIAIPMAVIPCDPHLRSLHCSPVNLDTSWANIAAFLHSNAGWSIDVWWRYGEVTSSFTFISFNVPEKTSSNLTRFF